MAQIKPDPTSPKSSEKSSSETEQPLNDRTRPKIITRLNIDIVLIIAIIDYVFCFIQINVSF
jgi:hypothetical protein